MENFNTVYSWYVSGLDFMRTKNIYNYMTIEYREIFFDIIANMFWLMKTDQMINKMRPFFIDQIGELINSVNKSVDKSTELSRQLCIFQERIKSPLRKLLLKYNPENTITY